MTEVNPNTFCTGSPERSTSSCPTPTIDPYKTPLDPDGPLGYGALTRLREGQSPERIAEAMDISVEQVEGLRRHLDGLPSFRIPREAA